MGETGLGDIPQRGESTAEGVMFDRWLKEHKKILEKLKDYCRRHAPADEWEDVFSEVMIDLWQTWINPVKKIWLINALTLNGFCLTLAKRRCSDAWRHTGRQLSTVSLEQAAEAGTLDILETHIMEPVRDPLQRLMKKAWNQDFGRVFESLKEQDQAVLASCYLHDMSPKEAAAMLQMNYVTYRSCLSRGRYRFFKALVEAGLDKLIKGEEI